jgi:hypothetical protein
VCSNRPARVAKLAECGLLRVCFAPDGGRHAGIADRQLSAKSGSSVDFAEPAQRSRATSPRGCDRTVCCEAAIHDSDSKRMEIADNRAYSGKQDRRPQDHCKIPGGLNFGADPFARRGCACMHVRTAIAGARSCRPLRHKPLRPRRPLRRNGHRRTSCARRAHGSCAASGRPRSPALWCPAERASAR